ncbi:Fc.00g084080.m01.CDS01 [Cosmosporella sp. VM-42]
MALSLAKNSSPAWDETTRDGDLDSSSSLKGAIESQGGILTPGSHASYVDSSHWSSILEDIREIREQISPSNIPGQVAMVESSTTGSDWTLAEEPQGDTDLVLESAEKLDLQQILGSLPSRQVCDGLVSNYFRSRFTILQSGTAILHPVKFQREYESFWEAPTETSPVWIGLLFAVISLAASVYEIANVSSGSKSLIPPARTLSKRAEQCLVLGKYATAKEHSIEALMVHMQSCYLGAKDSDVNLWLLMGVIIPLAIRMGYHRDPAKLSGSALSPFDGEMRRRVWVSIYQVDTLASFQMGLPSMIPSEYCDTELPRNLEYSDFYPETSVLPPSRPVSDRTSILYTISKAPILSMFKTVVAHTRSLITPPYNKTMALDGKVRDVNSALPDAFKYKPLRISVIDGPGIIMNRITIEMIHLKSIIVLHRQYIPTYRQDALYDHSRRAVLEAAQSILERQTELHQATQSGGQLHNERWMVSALTTTDFILAAMVICLELTIRMRQAETAWNRNAMITEGDDNDFGKLVTAIQVSHQIWVAASAYSAEARIAAHALESTIQRVNANGNTQSRHQTFQTSQATASHPHAASQAMWHIPEATDGMEFIDWSLLDNNFQGPLSEELDLDSWILDAVGPSDSFDLV